MKKFTLLWLQSGGCGGCSMSLLNAESPNLFEVFQQNNIELLWHPSISETCGEAFLQMMEKIESGEVQLDALCIEGSVMMGPNGTGRFHRLSGSKRPMFDLIDKLMAKANYTIAVGSCSSFGGITMAGNNPGEAIGLQYNGKQENGLKPHEWRSPSGMPVINIAGCPTHPNWVIETILQVVMGDFSAQQLDEFHRPRSYTDQLVHQGCPRNEFYEYKASAVEPSDQGCLMENLGCLGTQARADCNTRLWNGQGSCLRGGYSCINCTAPEFEEPKHAFLETPKIAGIPIGLPTDMPKAWFVALSSLSKAATPERLKVNAISDHIKIAPGAAEKKKTS